MKRKKIGHTKIEWCRNPEHNQLPARHPRRRGYVWNPVAGCLRGCEWCYARRYMQRFGARVFTESEVQYLLQKKIAVDRYKIHTKLINFQASFLEHAYQKEFPAKPSTIFITALTDPEYWLHVWWEKIREKIEAHPQHKFIVLTKSPGIYYGFGSMPKNMILGATALNNNEITTYQDTLAFFLDHTTFLSIEPLLEEIDPGLIDTEKINLVIVGGLQGQPKATKKEWVESFRYWHNTTCKLFEKNNLSKIFNAPYETELIQELPWVEE